MELTSKSIQFGRQLRHVGRLAHITNVFARHGLWSILERSGIRKMLTPEQVKVAEDLSHSPEAADAVPPAEAGDTPIVPMHLRMCLEELGPAFVKLGQVLATREDLLSPPFIEELRKLHRHVPALPYATIRDILQQELGAKRLADFESINEVPLAAGSIGQVHEAHFKDGRHVVVKVQRPGIARQIEIDLSLMEMLAAGIEKYVPETRGVRPATTIAEFRRALVGELDFVREGANTARFAANYEKAPHVEVPQVFWDYTTPRVLTMSFLEGISVWDRDDIVKSGLHPEILVERGVEAFLQSVFVDGLYHGDLHPGNLLALAGDRVGILDCGIAVHLSRGTREQLAGLLVALVEEDFDSVVAFFAELSDPGPEFDLEAFRHEVTNAVAPFVRLKLGEIPSGKLFWDLARIAARHGAPLPRELIVFLKTLVTFEGIGVRLCPGFDILASSQKFARRIVAEMYSADYFKRNGIAIARDLASLAKHAPFQIRRLLKAGVEGKLSFNVASEDFARLAQVMDRSSSRLALSLLAGALFIASAILTFGNIGGQYVHMSVLAIVGYIVAGVLGLFVVLSIVRGGGR